MGAGSLFKLNVLARALAFIWERPYHEVKLILAETDAGLLREVARSRRVRAVMRSML
jgi:hypothetical protein